MVFKSLCILRTKVALALEGLNKPCSIEEKRSYLLTTGCPFIKDNHIYYNVQLIICKHHCLEDALKPTNASAISIAAIGNQLCNLQADIWLHPPATGLTNLPSVRHYTVNSGKFRPP